MKSQTCPDCGRTAYYDGYFRAMICRQCGYWHIVDPLEDYRGLTPIEQLNRFRNLHYQDEDRTENGIIANALNKILPEYAKLLKENGNG